MTASAFCRPWCSSRCCLRSIFCSSMSLDCLTIPMQAPRNMMFVAIPRVLKAYRLIFWLRLSFLKNIIVSFGSFLDPLFCFLCLNIYMKILKRTSIFSKKKVRYNQTFLKKLINFNIFNFSKFFFKSNNNMIIIRFQHNYLVVIFIAFILNAIFFIIKDDNIIFMHE